uniref:Uncharacterized protein n=3 Tax=Oryza TaxID=4527 RepID=A0A0D3GZT3_9ORYZ
MAAAGFSNSIYLHGLPLGLWEYMLFFSSATMPNISDCQSMVQGTILITMALNRSKATLTRIQA